MKHPYIVHVNTGNGNGPALSEKKLKRFKKKAKKVFPKGTLFVPMVNGEPGVIVDRL